ncbi:DUF1351 domain-containing protein [Pediococcus ethanolidurans]|uniref:DUF1351 domain-containing protein n=1 Tax=Pediococcus ethanolidurans TaxID=319653 RepID=UPI0021A97EE9|nr:DUF1351 domain-containing protein [Pediococcus ethanolidurans]MCT4397666.1 DUF1351 domain-containing protein [Pediococcus ethanolidurans]
MTEELVPTKQLDFSVDYQPTKIVINNQDKLERALKAYINKYSGLVVSEQTLKDDKKVKKELNSLKKQLNSKRIEIHKTFDQPYTEFKASIDGMVSQIDEVVNPIDEGISKFEEQQKQQRLEDVKAEIAEMAPEYGVSVDEIEIEDSWLNKSLSKIKRTKAIADNMAYVRDQKQELANNVLSVTKYADSKDIEPAGWVEQLKQGQDLSYVMQAIDHAAEQKEIEVERARKQTEYQKSVDEANQKKVGNKTIDTNTGEVVREERSVVLEITGSLQDLYDVRHFLDDHGIKFERVQK